jgi:uncharacterized membrane protein SpoIIM required for sporulation
MAEPDRLERWRELTTLLDRSDRAGLGALSVEEVKRICRLYRHVTIDLSRARTDGGDPELVQYLNTLAARAHGCVYRSERVDIGPLFTFILRGFPALVRRQWRPVLTSTSVFVLTMLASFLAVVRQPELAYSLFDEQIVEYENLRLERQEGEYRGNFTFDISSSPLAAAAIIGNNIKVAVLAFASGALLCLPGVLLMAYNGRMLGTLTGLVWNHGFLLDFYSLILTHGVLELTAICIAGGAGLMLGWALIAPGPLPRRDALRQSSRDAFGLMAGSALLLVVAGLIEAYITPHFPRPVRWSVSAASALFLVGYLGLAGRRSALTPSRRGAAQRSKRRHGAGRLLRCATAARMLAYNWPRSVISR